MQRSEPTRFCFVPLTVTSWVILFLILASDCGGCGSPSAANIQLRKQNQDLQQQVGMLKDQQGRLISALNAAQRSHPTTAALSPERLDQLVTTHGLSFGRLTNGDNPDGTQSFDSQLIVDIVPTDGDGTPIKAAGTFKIEAFDLDDPAKPLVGIWNFDLNQTGKNFYNRFAIYSYILPCPFAKLPSHPDLTARVYFEDALTGRLFVSQTQVKIRLPLPQVGMK